MSHQSSDPALRLPAGPLQLPSLADYLLGHGVIDADQRHVLNQLDATQQDSVQHPIAFVAAQHFESAALSKPLTTPVLMEWLAAQLSIPIYHVDPLKVDVAKVTEQCSFSYANSKNILAVEVHPNKVVFATCEPCDFSWVEELSRLLQRDIDTVFLDPETLHRYQLEFYSLAKTMIGAEKDQTAPVSGMQSFEQLMELGRQGKLDANDQHVVSIVDWLLQYAYEQRASDIHLEPRRDTSGVRFRIDGVLHAVYDMPASVGLAVTSRLKIQGRMDVSEKRKPQDGRIKTRDKENREVELRLSTMPTAFGEKLVLRIFNPDVLTRDISELGFAAEERSRWLKMLSRTSGIVLVTGPTGSGKTSTLYASLKLLARPEVNVCTIEDPIELMEPSFNQMQVQHNIDLDFASGVRTLLRQDPDVIMVGEIRDPETAVVAVQAALTGHLVLSTMHTNDAPSAVARLMELGVPPYLINATLVGVLGQRLVRTLCEHCKTPQPVDINKWREFINPWRAPAPASACGPVGCLECRNTGFQGRLGIYELLEMDDSMRALVRDEADVDALRKKAYLNGMKPLRIGGARRVSDGATTVGEVLKVSPIAL
ncbi:MAG: GspE/PulE family protein [Granulosicoccaceae bacterium]